MSNSENNGMVMPVTPYYGGNGNGDGFGFNGGWWFILLLAVLGWGNGGFGNFGGGNGGGMFPWIMNGQNNGYNDVQRGFDHSAIMSAIGDVQNAVYTGTSGIQSALCSGFAGVNQGFASAEVANNARHMATTQQTFGLQTAMGQGFNQAQAQAAQIGYDTRSGIADLKYTVATENCADRNAAAQNTRDIIDNQNRNYQSLMDKLCALELDGVKSQLAQAQRENVGLQNQLNMAALRESQTAQNAFISQGFANEVDALYNRLNNCPVPTTPVYGRTPIFTCPNNNMGCGCGCGG